jgi:hypothetical protein
VSTHNHADWTNIHLQLPSYSSIDAKSCNWDNLLAIVSVLPYVFDFRPDHDSPVYISLQKIGKLNLKH